MHELGINDLTLPQIKAIPKILTGSNCLIIAPTGMGKTEAALLPIFHQFMMQQNETEKSYGARILYITPLRALNRDLLKRTFYWGKELGIRIAIRHGDTSQKERRHQAIRPPDMFITTPETLQIMLTGKKLRETLRTIRWVIIDEIHELAGDERGAQLSVALERLQDISGQFQRIGLSATIGNPQEVAKFLGGMHHVDVIDAMEEKTFDIAVERPGVNDSDHHLAITLGLDNQSAALLRRIKELIETHDATLIFVNTRDAAEILATRMREINVDIEVHHGSLSKEARIEAEEKFKRGQVRALICTSSLELGIDIGHADFVIQYNSPRQVTRLIQRVGRSGHRKGKISSGKILCINPEEYAEALIISKKALAHDVEKVAIRLNPVTVLANQIILMVVEYGKIPISHIYNTIKRAYPFFTLSESEYQKVLHQLENQRVLWIENNIARRRRKSTSYFIDNISMIPDEKSYDVIDISSMKTIGRLDESFVSDYCSAGLQFIMKGRAWEIAKKDEKIYVAPAAKTYTVPDWAGEELPVPFAIAQGVGKLRHQVASGEVNDAVISDEIDAQREEGLIVPTNTVITAESERTAVYINTHFGTKINETLHTLLGSLIAQRIGESVSTSSDAYRIQLTLPRSVSPNFLVTILLNIKPEAVEALLRMVLKKSSFLQWEAVKVARKFGILEKSAEFDRFSLERVMHLFKGTPFFEEIIERTIWERMDIPSTAAVLSKLQDGGIQIVTQRISPISFEGERMRQEFLKPFGIDASTIAALKKRLDETPITLVCMNCGHRMPTRVHRAALSCPHCTSVMLAVVTGEPNRSQEWLMKSASLVATHGKRAIWALAGYGIGPNTASRILAKQKDDNGLLKEVIKAEINYARTRRFWDT